MGNDNTICGCKCKPGETDVKLEENNNNNNVANKMNMIDMPNYLSQKKTSEDTNFNKNLSNLLNRNGLSSNSSDANNIHNYKQSNTRYQFLDINRSRDNNRIVDVRELKIIHIQSIYRGFYYRKIFPRIKETLKELLRKKLELVKYKFINTSAITDQLEKLIGPFNPKNWMNFYDIENKRIFEYDEGLNGRLYNCDLLLYKDTSYYIGTINIYNKRWGYGMLVDISGGKCEGMWQNDNLNGWGRMVDCQGNISEGLFINSKLTGKGIKYYVDGGVYKGDFVDNLKHGEGIEENAEHIYRGHFVYDEKDGQGELRYKTKRDTYEGEFKGGAITGIGKYTWENRDVYEGSFLGGKMHGKGKYLWADGDVYDGEYINGLKEGNGIFKWKNGKVYYGPFEKGVPHGCGEIVHDGKKYSVKFNEGKLIENQIIGKVDN